MKLGTRQSRLALAQSGLVARALGPDVELVGMDSEGDRIIDAPLVGALSKGFFTDALESALRSGAIDLAVHSLKDLPVEPAEGLVIAAVPRREAPNDMLLVRSDAWSEQASGQSGALPLRIGARVGSTSPRRGALLRTWGREVEVVPLRGNVTTRVERLRDGKFDAIVLAEAGLQRLGAFSSSGEVNLSGLRLIKLDLAAWPAAPGQGALALQCRATDDATRARLAALHHAETALAVHQERTWLALLGGGCSLPFGASIVGNTWSFVLDRGEGGVPQSGHGIDEGTIKLKSILSNPTNPTALLPPQVGVEIHVHSR